jgi:hypothetical protein
MRSPPLKSVIRITNSGVVRLQFRGGSGILEPKEATGIRTLEKKSAI